MTALAPAPELTEAAGRTTARVGGRPVAPGRRGVRTRPVGRPGNCPAPQLGRSVTVGSSAQVGSRSCALVAGEHIRSTPEGAQWRLTDRGIAVVLALGVLLGVAATVCIGLRAVEVTGADYQAASHAPGVSSPAR
ncbi:MAG: hypothetical protein ACTH2Q_15250 [Propionibacteriaceae bacterium]